MRTKYGTYPYFRYIKRLTFKIPLINMVHEMRGDQILVKNTLIKIITLLMLAFI